MTMPVQTRTAVAPASRPRRRVAARDEWPVGTVRVLKFGGSSLATPERVAGVAKIVLDNDNGVPGVVVVSAYQGVTNDLLECARLAERRDRAYERAHDAIVTRHRAAVDHLFGSAEARGVHARLDQLIADLGEALHGIALLRYCPPAALDSVASFGERFSALTLAEYLNRFRPARFVDARQFIVTDDEFTHANVHVASSGRAIRRYFESLWSGTERPLPVVTGFIGCTKDGRTTTVGRNGSDYTAAIVGSALYASAIEIWTDVDGVLSADPRAVRSAFVLPEITYEQAHDLSYFGAKVLYPAAIGPAVAKSIPIVIKNTFNPSAPGTLIRTDPAAETRSAAGVTSMADVTLLTLVGSRTAAPRLAERLFGALGARGTDVLLASQASSDRTISVAVATAEADAAARAIRREFRFELRQRRIALERKSDQALIALVGEGAAGRPRLAWQVLAALGRHGIGVNALAEGGTSRSMACIVDGAQRSRALNVIHRGLFETHKPLAIAIVGVGKVGSALLRQLAERQSDLRERGFDVTVVALANSRSFVLSPEGIALDRWREQLSASTRAMNASELAADLAALDLPAGAVVDCTAADEVVEAYPDFIKANLHVVTPNKRASVLPWRRYTALTKLLAARDRHFLYEGTVGAGLPIISTIKDLVQSGDRILKIEGIFSGTLSYLFNTLDGSTAFSELVRDAHRKGFTEPDPREDLSGLDVARKLLILAREAGSTMELEDVRVEPLLPAELSAGPFSAQFFAGLARYDGAMTERLEAARSRGSVLRYVGTLDRNGGRAGLRELPGDHPLAATKGADNSIAFTTTRYSETPLVVQGPGAGAEVTAMAVFSDLLKLLRYLPQ